MNDDDEEVNYAVQRMDSVAMMHVSALMDDILYMVDDHFQDLEFLHVYDRLQRVILEELTVELTATT